MVTDGIESAVSQAKAAAGGKSVGLHGADTMQQCLNAGLLDEIHVDLAAVVLGSGVRLFDRLAGTPFVLGNPTVIASAGVTHLRYPCASVRRLPLKNAVIVGLMVMFSFGCATTATQSAAVSTRTAVAREWKGRVAPARADEYHAHLLEGVKKMRAIAGYLGVEVMRRDEPDAVTFTVISYWESRESIKAYAGEDIEKPRHLPIDKEILLELPTRVLHYDVTYTDLQRVRLRD